MKHIFLIIFILITLQPFAQTGAQIKKIGLMVAPGTLGANAVTLLWDKQPGVTTYTVFLNGKNRGSSTKTNITVENLKPSTQYSAVLYTHSKNKKRKSSSLNFKTPMQDVDFIPLQHLLTRKIEYVMSNSFGFSGSNSTLIFSNT